MVNADCPLIFACNILKPSANRSNLFCVQACSIKMRLFVQLSTGSLLISEFFPFCLSKAALCHLRSVETAYRRSQIPFFLKHDHGDTRAQVLETHSSRGCY